MDGRPLFLLKHGEPSRKKGLTLRKSGSDLLCTSWLIFTLRATPVDEVHFDLKITIGEGHFFPADHRHLFAQVFRADPAESQFKPSCSSVRSDHPAQ